MEAAKGNEPPDRQVIIIKQLMEEGKASSDRCKEQYRLQGWMMTHKYRGSIVVLSISKSVEPSEEQKEMTSGF